MPFGPVDYSGVDRFQQAVGDFSDQEQQAAQVMQQLKERAADRRQASAALEYIRNQDFSDVGNIPKAAQALGTMLSGGGPESEKAAQYAHQTFQTAIAAANAGKEKAPPQPHYVYNDVLTSPDPNKLPVTKTEGGTINRLTQLHAVVGNTATPVPNAYTYRTIGTIPSSEFRESSGLTKQETAFKERLEKEEQQLLGQVKSKYPDIDLDKIAASQTTSPIIPGTEDTEIVYHKDKMGNNVPTVNPDGTLAKRVIPGTGKPDALVNKWVGALKAKEDWYRTHNLQSGYQNRYGGVAIGAPSGATDEDAQAIAWAKANPNDPRAAKILKLHGVQ